MTLSTGLALLASAVFLVRLLPQPVRLARTGVPDGVSPLAALNFLVSCIAWLVYGVSAHLTAVWAVSIPALVPAMWIVLLLRRSTTACDGLGVALFVTMLGLAAALGVFAGALALSVLVTCGPQVWRAIRSRDLSGVSAATWWVAIVDGSAWGAYGLAVGDPALKGYGVVLVTSAVIILSRLRVTRTSPATRLISRQEAPDARLLTLR